MTGWREGLGPWQAVIENGKLYGRGGADDGYAIFLGTVGHCRAASAEYGAPALRGVDRNQRGIG